jgi:hypothetical protein
VVVKAALENVFSETSVSPANHSTYFYIIIITRGWHNNPIGSRSAEWTQLESTLHYTNFKKNLTGYGENSLIDSRQGDTFLFSTVSTPALEPTEPHIRWVPGALPIRRTRAHRFNSDNPITSKLK